MVIKKRDYGSEKNCYFLGVHIDFFFSYSGYFLVFYFRSLVSFVSFLRTRLGSFRQAVTGCRSQFYPISDTVQVD